MKKADLRDIIEMWREVAMVRLTQVQGLEERLAATQRPVAQQAMVRGGRFSTAEAGARVTVECDGMIRSYDATGVRTFGPPEVGRLLDPADTAKVGDVLPESWTDFKLNHGCTADNRGYHCTRRPHSSGQHVATVTRRVVHVWPNDDGVVDAVIHDFDCPGGRCSCPGADVERAERDRTAAIQGVAITIAHHARVQVYNCVCGWTPQDPSHTHARHVAEQLAALGVLGDHEPVATEPVLIDREGDEWVFVGGAYRCRTGERTREQVDAEWGPVIEKAIES